MDVPINLSIRPEEPRDAVGVRETNLEAFDTPLEARLVDALRGSAGSISLVAVTGDRVIGHVFFTPVTVEPPVAVRIAGLGPMAVRPQHQRHGVGSALVQAGLAECRRGGYSAVVVVGHPAFYPRFGFEPAHRKGLACEFPVPPEVFMLVELEPGSLDRQGGRVRYRPEFSEE